MEDESVVRAETPAETLIEALSKVGEDDGIVILQRHGKTNKFGYYFAGMGKIELLGLLGLAYDKLKEEWEDVEDEEKDEGEKE